MNETSLNLRWQAAAIEALLPIRTHLHELIQAVDEYNAFARRTDSPLVFPNVLAKAQAASDEAEAFFHTNPDRPPSLLRARVAGDTIRDLIEALQQLDPDLKHGVEEVVRGDGWVEGLGIEPEKYARLEEEVEDMSSYEYALIEIRDSKDLSAEDLRDIAREILP